ncbi:MAG: UvrD-helicase domain-containing protein [Tannerellaceae bacterium]|jgi:ATP-dependent exoDNAse (exonuclease V) beta subunit|nr:UvrD-helicase domain-containing protein [Tannerellaceae bacterium]
MLTIYRASAGAGKTHRLTGEYLKLLFTAVTAYRHILAVTFTNKATDEMKGRIIEELHKLSTNRKSQHLTELAEACSLNEQQIRIKAKAILTAILHDYGSFNISTIDRFFQQTMRAFSREIGMQGGYTIEMDQDLVLSEAVDNMLVELGRSNSRELLEWLLRFSMDRIESGAGWNPRADIISLGKELFKENYRTHSQDVSKDIEDKKALEAYKNELYTLAHKYEAKAKQLGEDAMNIMKRHGLAPSDFVKKSVSPLQLFKRMAEGEMKEPTKTFVALADNIEGWYAKKDGADLIARIENAYSDGLNRLVKETIDFHDNLTDYRTAREILRFYYTLGILTDVSNQIAAYRTEKNILLIADTTELLSRIIDGSDTPFIYERTGTRIDHYMIDEFQDTSRMQWTNFRPLLAESLAHGQDNLVVGDVKQSIYRFRNSDWSLLDEQIQKDFRIDQVAEETLEENWRSAREIVMFNNFLFQTAPAILQDNYNIDLEESSLNAEEKSRFGKRIVHAYKRSAQSIPAPLQNTTGHVAMEFLPDDDTDWREEATRRLPTMLEHLQDNGYEPKDIAILVRTNREAAMIANALLVYKEEHPSEHYKYDIISDDALFVGNSSAVRFLISMLRHLNAPASSACRQMAVFAYSYLSGNVAAGQRMDNFPNNIQDELNVLSKYALYETVEALLRLFADCISDNEQVFVQAFLDMTLEFGQRENADTERFLAWWDNTGTSKTIATPDGQNAVRILTIHKSKGLGFKAVIIPFCEWEIDHRPTGNVILWCRPADQAPFDRLRAVPLKYSANLANTHFAADYFEERLQAAIDNLNTLYVAFTRAKEELLVMAPRKTKLNSVAGLLLATLQHGNNPAMNPDDAIYERGTTTPLHQASAKPVDVEEIPMSKLQSVSAHDRLRLRLNYQRFAGEAERRHGTRMHEILSRIHTLDDITHAIETCRLNGFISTDEAGAMAAELNRLLRLPEVAEWFDGSYKVMNEAEILSAPAATHRPDRVMIKNDAVTVIDYKFGALEAPQHLTQVRNYIELIRRMGYADVKGFLWYVSLEKTVEVNI